MYVLRLYPYYFGTVYIPTFNLQVFLNGLSRKLQPVAFHGGYLHYQARESRKGLLNQHSQRPTLFWLQMESLKTCTHDICWSDLFWFHFVFVRLLAFLIRVKYDCFLGVQPLWVEVRIVLVIIVVTCFVWHKRHVRFVFTTVYMYVVRLSLGPKLIMKWSWFMTIEPWPLDPLAP